jgi:hypothetical protein
MLSNLLENTLKIYKDEQKAFFWMAALLFLIRASGILFENYAETAFLKRYGVQYLPNIFMINAIILFFTLTYIGLLIDKYKQTTLLIWLFYILAGTTILFRILIIFNFSITYPVLYLISFQLKNTPDLIFWILANTLFNTRQAKRVYPAIISGGILGIILGSLLTSPLARVIRIDNILLVSAAMLFVGSLTTLRVEKILLPIMQSQAASMRKKKKPVSAIRSFVEIFPMMKTSQLFRIFLVLVIVPAILLPIFNYQWGVITNRAFTSEGGLIAFYGYFKGIYNILTFVILFFIGRLFAKFGISKILFVHPVNYFLVFLALIFRFDLFVAIYGRVSTNIFRSTTNRPALNMLANLFAPDIRGRVAAFLKGTALRVGALLGSGILLGLKGFITPEQFSYIATGFCAVLVLSCYFLKRIYSDILMKNLIESQIDLQTTSVKDLKRLMDEKTKHRLIETLEDQNDNVSILSARILSYVQTENLSRILFDIMPQKSQEVKKVFLGLIGKEGNPENAKELLELYEKEDPGVQPAVVRAIGETDPKGSSGFLVDMTGYHDPEIKQEAIIALYHIKEPEKIESCRELVREMLVDGNEKQIIAGLEILRRTKDESLSSFLMNYLEHDSEEIRLKAMAAAGELKNTEATEKLFLLLKDDNPAVRKTAVHSLGSIWKEEV